MTFNPTSWGQQHTNPSYHVPAFYETWARFLERQGKPGKEFWQRVAAQSRRFLVK